LGIPARSAQADVDGHLVELSDFADPPGIIESLGTGDWWRLFCMIDQPDHELYRRICDRRDGFDAAAALSLTRVLVETLTGYPFFTACSLAATAVSDWATLDGMAAYQGFDPWTAPVARTLAFVHHCLKTSRDTPGDLARLEHQLAGPEADEDRPRAPDSSLARAEASMVNEWLGYFGDGGESLYGG